MPSYCCRIQLQAAKRRAANHILARRVARREIESQVHELARDVWVNVLQFRDGGSRLRFPPDLGCVPLHPRNKFASRASIAEDKHGCALHGIGEHRAPHTAAQVENLAATIVRGNQRPFGGCQRNQKLAVGVFAMDLDRASDPNRNLRHPDEILTIAFGQMRVKGILKDMVRARAARLCNKGPSLLNDFGRVIVTLRTRNARWMMAIPADRILDLQSQLAERTRFEGNLDFVPRLLQLGRPSSDSYGRT